MGTEEGHLLEVSRRSKNTRVPFPSFKLPQGILRLRPYGPPAEDEGPAVELLRLGVEPGPGLDGDPRPRGVELNHAADADGAPRGVVVQRPPRLREPLLEGLPGPARVLLRHLDGVDLPRAPLLPRRGVVRAGGQGAAVYAGGGGSCCWGW